MAMSRTDIVRAAYQRFNEEDFDGALDLCDPDVEFRELIGRSGPAHGREAVRQRWMERFSSARVTVTVGDVVEVGDSVLAAVCCQVYDPTGMPIGPYVLVTDHFSFREGRILRIKTTLFEDVPEEVRGLLLPATP